MAYTLAPTNRIKFASHSSGASLYGQSFNSLGQRGKLTWAAAQAICPIASRFAL